MPLDRHWFREEGCEFCVKVTRIVLAVVADFIIALVVLLLARALGRWILLLFHDEPDGQVYLELDLYVRVGTLLVLAGLLILDIVLQSRRSPRPPC